MANEIGRECTISSFIETTESDHGSSSNGGGGQQQHLSSMVNLAGSGLTDYLPSSSGTTVGHPPRDFDLNTVYVVDEGESAVSETSHTLASGPVNASSTASGSNHLTDECDGKPVFSPDGRHLPCKRKAMEVTGHLSLGGSSSGHQPAEKFACHGQTNRSVAINSNMSSGAENSVAVNRHPSLRVLGPPTSLQRNTRMRIDPFRQYEAPSMQNVLNRAYPHVQFSTMPTSDESLNSGIPANLGFSQLSNAVSVSGVQSYTVPASYRSLDSGTSTSPGFSQLSNVIGPSGVQSFSVPTADYSLNSGIGLGFSQATNVISLSGVQQTVPPLSRDSAYMPRDGYLSSLTVRERVPISQQTIFSRIRRAFAAHQMNIPVLNLTLQPPTSSASPYIISIPGSPGFVNSRIHQSFDPTLVPHSHISGNYPAQQTLVRRALERSSNPGTYIDVENIDDGTVLRNGLQAQLEERSMPIHELRRQLEIFLEEGHSDPEAVAAAYSLLHHIQLDIDSTPPYEELHVLEERIGAVRAGLTEDTIVRYLKLGEYVSVGVGGSSEIESCCICQEEFVEGEELGMLDCGHDFHTGCIKRWLMEKNSCPICKAKALTEAPDTYPFEVSALS